MTHLHSRVRGSPYIAVREQSQLVDFERRRD